MVQLWLDANLELAGHHQSLMSRKEMTGPLARSIPAFRALAGLIQSYFDLKLYKSIARQQSLTGEFCC